MNCILLYGSDIMPLQKHCAPFRLATELRKNNYSVQCIDLSAFIRCKDFTSLKLITKNFITNDTYWIGISITFFSHLVSKSIENFLTFIKEQHPYIKIIIGGSNKHFALNIDTAKVFKNYCDLEIVEFTDLCSGKSSVNKIKFLPDIIYGKEFINFPESQILYESNDLIDPNDCLPLEVSRGCIFKCKFCAFPLNGKTKGEWIKKTSFLLDEINRNYEYYGIKNYSFVDDTYNDSLDKLKILDEHVFNKLKFKINYTAYLRLDLIIRYPEMINFLTRSGLTSALFGIESLNPKSAKVIGKGGIEPMEQIKFLQNLKENEFKNILLGSGFIYGLPYDTKETIIELESFLLSDNNPLDSWFIGALWIYDATGKKHAYYSDFDRNYKDYGYTLENNKWSHTKSGLNYDYCQEQVDKLMEKSRIHKKYKFGGFIYNYMKRFSIADEELLNLSFYEVSKKYNVNNLIFSTCKKYIDSLHTLSTHGISN